MKIGIFKGKMRSLVHRVTSAVPPPNEREVLLLGRLMADRVREKETVGSLSDVEFRAFSQFGDDGIIQWLIHRLDIPTRTFVEFGVENYRESNTRFLLLNNNWSGLIMDGSAANVEQIVHSEYYWRHHLLAKAAWVTAENVNNLIESEGLRGDIGLLHIDVDGNDYWIWKALQVVSPIVLVVEYNSVFGMERSITVPYDPTFTRTEAHYSNLYFGASISALHALSVEKGYAFIGCNSAGNNAYFVRRDRLTDDVREVSLEAGYVESMFRESRNQTGGLTHLAGNQRLEAIAGLPVVDTRSNRIELI